MIRLFVLIGLIGGGGVVYLATYGVAPEGQLPPVVNQLVKFEAAGIVPGANDLVENPEVGHGISEVPAEDEAQLEMALANMSDMPGMNMGGMDMGEGSTMKMAEGATMKMAEGSTMEMTEGATMEMGESSTMEMAEAGHGDGTMASGGLLITVTFFVEYLAGQHQGPGRGVDQRRTGFAKVFVPVRGGDLVVDQGVDGFGVGNPQQCFGQAHQRHAFLGGQAVFGQKDLHQALGLAGADVIDQRYGAGAGLVAGVLRDRGGLAKRCQNLGVVGKVSVADRFSEFFECRHAGRPRTVPGWS